jgi:hypothetical protein
LTGKDACLWRSVAPSLAQPHWKGRFTPRDYSALTPLWEHVNPYGRFDLDMNTRLDLP